jgi:PAS domain S-box-containing protein/putative nucleotidyltransferase with HDIG domain
MEWSSYMTDPLEKSILIQAEYFKDIVATIREPLLVLDADLRVLAANHSFYKFFKVKAGDTIGRLVYDLGDRQWDIPGLRLLLETILPQKAVFNDYNVEHDFPFIGRRTLLLNARRVARPPDKAQWILLAFEDVTEHIEMERKLQASEERFRRAFETAQDGMLLIKKTAGQILNSNQSAEHMLGYSKRSLRKKNLWELAILKDERQFRQTSLDLEEKGVVDFVDKEIPTRDGGNFLADIYLMDRAAVIQCNIRDISERKLAEEKISTSENELRSLFAAMTDVVFVLDGEGRYLRIAPTKPINLYRQPEDLLGKTVHEVLPKEQADFMIAKIRAAIQTKQTVLGEYALQIDGKEIWFASSTSRLSENSVIWVAHDITERRRTESERQSLLEIMQGVASTENLNELLDLIRQSLAKVIYAENFFVIFKNKDTGLFEEVYAVDKYDPAMPPSKLEKSMISYVFRTGESLLLTQAKFEELVILGEAELIGTQPAIWMGAPLKTPHETIGVIAVQNYEDPDCYSEHDKDFLASVSAQVAVALERKRTEEAMHKSEEKYRGLVTEISDGIFVTDDTGTLTFVNPTLARIHGFDHPDQMLGRTFQEFIAPPMLNEAGKYFKQVIEGELPQAVLTTELIRPDGSYAFVEVMASVEQSGGKVVGTHGIVRDITKRKQSEEEARSRTEDLATLYQLSRALSDANDLENVIELVNRQVVENVHTTFACIALLEAGDLVPRAVYSVRNQQHNFSMDVRQPMATLPTCQRIMEKNETVILQADTPEVSRAERTFLLLDFARSVCLVPLRVGDASQVSRPALGLLILGEARQEKREPFTPGKIRLARSIGDQAASAIHRSLLSQQTERRLRQLTALSNIDRAISSTFDLHISLGLLLEHVTQQLGVDATDVLLFNPHSLTLEFSAGNGFRTKSFEQAHLRLGEGYAGQAAFKREIVHIPDLAGQHDNPRLDKHLADEQFVSYYGVPLISKGQIMGVLEIFQRARLEPDKEWLDFLGIMAGQAAIAIDSVMQFDNVQRSNNELVQAYDETIVGWSHALDLRDKETEGHTQRVTEMTLKLAHAFDIDEADLVQVRWGALLHDIGKMGVPDGILLKPGPLTAEEWLIMKKHPTFAYEMLSPIHFLKAALDIPFCHHEKWDGTGYPRGLKGEQIPLAARIFAVVDVWDALISDRPYRQAWSKEKTRQHIQAGAGTHFDPQVVKTFFLENGENGSIAP